MEKKSTNFLFGLKEQLTEVLIENLLKMTDKNEIRNKSLQQSHSSDFSLSDFGRDFFSFWPVYFRPSLVLIKKVRIETNFCID